MSVRGLSGVGLTSAPHRTFADPAPPLPTYSATPPPPDPIIPDATHPTCLSALPTTPVYRSRACRGATVGPSVADLAKSQSEAHSQNIREEQWVLVHTKV